VLRMAGCSQHRVHPPTHNCSSPLPASVSALFVDPDPAPCSVLFLADTHLFVLCRQQLQWHVPSCLEHQRHVHRGVAGLEDRGQMRVVNRVLLLLLTGCCQLQLRDRQMGLHLCAVNINNQQELTHCQHSNMQVNTVGSVCSTARLLQGEVTLGWRGL